MLASLTFAILDWDGLHMGDVPTWLAAVGTLAAFGVGLGVLNLQRKDLRERDDDSRKDQARRISVWCESVTPVTNDGVVGISVHYRNASEEPVYELLVYVRSALGLSNTHVGTVPPGADTDVTMNVSERVRGEFAHVPPVLSSFRDSANRWWIRDEQGELLARSREEVLAFTRGEA